ncbi:MAG TPA: TetR family transcriptional regulator [Phycisphaerales bacterium]|nr:TetR family transcriptional regulator [Phycisphaerales bacterium]
MARVKQAAAGRAGGQAVGQGGGRANQRARTRKDLLTAAARLLKSGRSPDMDEVAMEAGVSRATAYRYFPTVEALLAEAPVDRAVPESAAFFEGDTSTDPVERALRAEAAMHEVVYANAAQLRLMLAASVTRVLDGERGVPLRQNRRTPLIEAALEPVRAKLGRETYRQLCAALALVFGTESMIVLTDVLGMPEPAARKVKAWAVEMLVEGALREAASRRRGG